jgi:hypothetical protein
VRGGAKKRDFLVFCSGQIELLTAHLVLAAIRAQNFNDMFCIVDEGPSARCQTGESRSR